MRYILAARFSCFCNPALSAPLELPQQCQKVGISQDSVSLSIRSHEFILQKAQRACNSEYLYKENSSPNKGGTIISSPTNNDLGINAQNIIYSISYGSNEAVYIGEIPASATEVAEGVYQHIIQAGGSVYENTYRIESGKIKISLPSKELIISGNECIYESEGNDSCKNIAGSFSYSVCILNHTERKLLASIEHCNRIINHQSSKPNPLHDFNLQRNKSL